MLEIHSHLTRQIWIAQIAIAESAYNGAESEAYSPIDSDHEYATIDLVWGTDRPTIATIYDGTEEETLATIGRELKAELDRI